MNGSRPPSRTSGDVDPFAAALGFIAIGGGCLGFWWWSIGDVARMHWLGRIQKGSGYGPPPANMLAQVEWLATNRMNDLAAMFPLFVLAAATGIVEGNARRQTEVLSGFGLRRFNFGRALVLLWLAGVAMFVAAPFPLPYGWVGTALTALLLWAMHTISRGLRRVH